MISIIVAMAKNRIIGHQNQIPWHLPADLAYFKKITMGHPVIMGRKTFESIGKPLPGRENIIITSNKDYQPEGCVVLHSIKEVLTFCSGKDIFVIGGAKIYQQLLPFADRIYLTLIEKDLSGDSFFPEINEQSWSLVSKTKGEQDEKNPYKFYFLIFEKRK